MSIESVEKIILRDERTPWLNIHSVYDEMPLTLEAFRVLCHLSRRANNQTGEAKTTYKNIGEICFKATYPNSTLNTLRRRAIKAVAELEGFGLVKKIPWYSSGGDLLGNIFILTHTDEWKLDFDPTGNRYNLVRGIGGDADDTSATNDTGDADDTRGCYGHHQVVSPESPGGVTGETEYKGNPQKKSEKVIQEGNPIYCDEKSEQEVNKMDEGKKIKRDSRRESQSKTNNAQYEKEFDELFWPIAFKKVSRGAALTAYKTARRNKLKTEEERDDMLKAWKYANETIFPTKAKQDGHKKYVPAPSTWLNQERWGDEDVQSGLESRVDGTIDINQMTEAEQQRMKRLTPLMEVYNKYKNGGNVA